MKAFLNTTYGSPDVLKLEEIPVPKPKAEEVLVKVASLSINPAELHLLRATIWMVRLASGLLKPRNPVLGADVAGEVVAVGANVKTLKVGDRVFGRTHSGGLAEFVCLKEEKANVLPQTIDYDIGAALPLVGITALVALRDYVEILPGQQVLINGASGGIGTIAVQLAKNMGAEVTAVCSTPNVQLVKDLGADHVIDYKKENFTAGTNQYDVIIDLVGNHKVREMEKAMKPDGSCVVVGFTNFKTIFGYMARGRWLSATTSKKIVVIDAALKREDLAYLADLIQEGTLKPVIDKTFPFNETPRAFEYLASRRAKGKIVIKLLN